MSSSPQASDDHGHEVARADATRNLPVETLSLIFKAAVDSVQPNGDSDHSYHSDQQFTLAAVCSRWREVAFKHTPILWTSVILHLRSPNHIPSKAQLLDLHLTKSGTLPLKITFIFHISTTDCPFLQPGALFHDSVDDKLKQSLPRICQLSLIDMPPLNLESWLVYSPWLSRIRTYQLCSCPAGKDIDMTHNTSLASVKFSSVRGQILLPWDAITTIELHSVAIDVCLTLLFQCRNLCQYRVEAPMNPLQTFEGAPGRMMTLPCLTDFTWSDTSPDGDRDWNNKVYCFLDAPALSVLRWKQPEREWSLDAAPLRDFFHRLPSTVQSMDLVVTSAIGNSILELIPSHLQLRRLFLSSPDVDALKLTCSLLQPTEGEDSVPKLATLSDLTLTTSSPTHCKTLDSQHLAEILNGLSDRFKPGSSLTITFEGLNVECDAEMLSDCVIQAVQSGSLVLRNDKGVFSATSIEARL